MPSKSKYRQNNVFYSEIQTKVLQCIWQAVKEPLKIKKAVPGYFSKI